MKEKLGTMQVDYLGLHFSSVFTVLGQLTICKSWFPLYNVMVIAQAISYQLEIK